MTFKGRGKSAGDFKGNGTTNTNGTAYGYEQPAYGYAPVAPVAPAAK
jgi:hypothetical protein